MEKIDIFNFRTIIQKGIKSKIPNVNLIKNILISKGFVRKEIGLCAEPWNKYFGICNTDDRVLLVLKVHSTQFILQLMKIQVHEEKESIFIQLKLTILKDFTIYAV